MMRAWSSDAMRGRLTTALVLFVVGLVLLADPASACAACGTQKSENDWAFGATTLFLSLFPPVLLAGFVFFIVRTIRRAEERADEPTSTPPFSTPD